MPPVPPPHIARSAYAVAIARISATNSRIIDDIIYYPDEAGRSLLMPPCRSADDAMPLLPAYTARESRQ